MGCVQFVYFHGQPGSPDELLLVRPDGWRNSEKLYVPDRAAEHPELALGPYLDRIKATIAKRYPEGPIRLVGFSLGGVIAIEVALRFIEDVDGRDISLDLISTPAPLSSGDFLPEMAGGMVFSLARNAPWLFGLMTSIQGMMSRLAPALLFNQIFSTATAADMAIAQEPESEARLQTILANSLQRGARGYRREILAYASDDGARLSKLDRPVRLWQGLADNWTPPSMTQPFVHALPNATVTTFEKLSHYSTLRAALPEIFKDLS